MFSRKNILASIEVDISVIYCCVSFRKQNHVQSVCCVGTFQMGYVYKMVSKKGEIVLPCSSALSLNYKKV